MFAFITEVDDVLALNAGQGIAAQCSSRFDEQRFSQEMLAHVPDEIKTAIIRAVPKRQAEFIAGRYCALRALYELKRLSNYWVRRNEDRSPLWPDSTVGSISHTTGFAVALAADAKRVLSAGIDIELILSDEQASDLGETILSGFAPCTQALGYGRFVSLVFSAKETVYKALHPVLQEFMEFKDADCVTVDMENQLCTIKFKKPLRHPLLDKQEFNVEFGFNHELVMTRLLILRDSDQLKGKY